MKDKELLRLFLNRVDELRSTRLVRNGYESGITMKWTEDTGTLNFQLLQPDEELFRSLLLTLRHFLLAKEPTYIYKIYNVCHRFIKNEQHKQYLSKSRTFLGESMKSTGIQLNIDEKQFSPDYIWDIYINGLYFHNDTEKMKIINNLNYHERLLVKNELFGFVNSAVRQILYVGRIVALALDNNEI